MGKRVLHTHKQRSGKPASCAAGLLGMALLCLPLACAAGRFGVDTQVGIVEIAAAGVGVQDLTPLAGTATDPRGQDQLVATVRPNYVIFDCQQIENEADSAPSSAMRALDPAGAVRNMFQTEQNPIDAALITVRVLQEPRHGKIRMETANTGYKFFAYDPTPGYLGKDEVFFLATSGATVFKVITTLQVVKIADERPDQTMCPEPQSVKVASGAA